VSAQLAQALVQSLDEAALRELAAALAPYLPAPVVDEDRWMSTRDAAEYAGCGVSALHKAMAARDVEFAQECAGGKAWFRRSDIDRWRRGG
jgi:hypothetical protein